MKDATNKERQLPIPRHAVDIELDSVDTADYPDFADAYICSASWSDTGKELTEVELDTLNAESDLNQLALESLT